MAWPMARTEDGVAVGDLRQFKGAEAPDKVSDNTVVDLPHSRFRHNLTELGQCACIHNNGSGIAAHIWRGPQSLLRAV